VAGCGFFRGATLQVADFMDNSNYKFKNLGQLSDIPSAFIQGCLYLDNIGDGLLFTVIHAGRFAFDQRSKTWVVIQQSGWQPDFMDEALVGVETVANIYCKAAETTGKKSALPEDNKLKRKYFSRYWKLNSDRGRRRCLAAAKRFLTVG